MFETNLNGLIVLSIISFSFLRKKKKLYIGIFYTVYRIVKTRVSFFFFEAYYCLCLSIRKADIISSFQETYYRNVIAMLEKKSDQLPCAKRFLHKNIINARIYAKDFQSRHRKFYFKEICTSHVGK